MGDDELLSMALPTTKEEYHRRLQLARREGYFAGAHHSVDFYPVRVLETIRAAAREKFPIRRPARRKVFLAPRLPDASMVAETREDGGLVIRNPDGSERFAINGTCTELIRDLLNDPTEEVEE